MVGTKNYVFEPRLPFNPLKKKGIKGGRMSKNGGVESPPTQLPYGLTDDHIPTLMDYHTLRSLAYKSMGLRLSCPSNYKVFRVAEYQPCADQARENNLKIFETRWKELVHQSKVCWPEAVNLMNSLTLAYIQGEYDPHFKQILFMGTEEIDRLLKYMAIILQKL